MINFNGELLTDNQNYLNHTNRGLRYGDSVFETLKVVNSKILFWEDHYFRLMSSMRILRMEIPMTFTLEFLQEEIQKLIEENGLAGGTARVRFTVYRDSDGLYCPETNVIGYIIEAVNMQNPFYTIDDNDCEVELFKDFYVESGLLSTLKTNNKVINVVASIYAKENGYDNCLLVNNNKNIVEAINGNVFLVKGSTVKTPPVSEGCLNGVMRKQLIAVLEKMEGVDLVEAPISPFELQKSDELFITNVIQGIKPVTRYRKKNFKTDFSKEIIGKLNVHVRLSNA